MQLDFVVKLTPFPVTSNKPEIKEPFAMKRILAATLTVAALLLTAKSQAGTDTWNKLSSGNASGSWNTAANPPWSTGSLPGTTDTADFSTLDITADSTVTLDGNQSVNAIIFGDTTTSSAAGWILSPGTPATATLTLSGTTPTITVNALATGKGVTNTVSLAGTAGLTKAGVGTLTLAATNSYTGTTIVNAGTLSATISNTINGSGLTLSSSGSQTVILPYPNKLSGTVSFQGGTLILGDNNALGTGSFSLGNSGMTIQSSISNLSLANNFGDGTPNLIFAGTNSITTAGNSWTGYYTSIGINNSITSGTLTIAEPIYMASANTFSYAWTINGAGNTVVSGVMNNQSAANGAGNCSLTYSGTGLLTLTAANGYTGGTVVSSGILEADNNSALGTGLLKLSGGTVSNNVGSTLSNPVNLSANSTVGVGASQALTMSGTITNTGGLTKSGAGTLTLTAVNGYTGATTVNGGTLALTGSGAVATNSAITLNGGTLDMGSQNATNFTGNNGINFGANGGTLNGNGTEYMFGVSGAYTAFTVAANASAVINENLNITNTANSGYFNLVNAGSGGMLTINGVLTALNNPSGLFLTGGGALTLNNAANNFNTIIYNSGTLITTNFATLGSYPYLAQIGQGVANGPCTFNYAGTAASTTRSIIGNAALINVNNNGSGLATFTASPFNLRYGSAQTGAGQQLVFGGTSDLVIAGVIQDNTSGTYVTGVVKTNANTLTLYGNSTYSGATTIKGGSLIGVTAGSCSNSAVTLAAITGSSAVLGVTVTNTTKQWTISSLTVNNGGVSSSLQFNFGPLTPGMTAAPLNVTGALTFTTTPAIIITGSSLPASAGNGYPLMTWGSGGPATTNGMTLSLPFRAGGSLAIVGNTLYLQSSGSTEPLSWTGGSGTWDTNNTGNLTWKDNTSGSAYYVDADSVVFDNTVGTGGTVTLNTSVSPASVTVANPTANYTLSGSGGIAGGAVLTKSGAGTLTLTTSNSFTGTTTVNGGILLLTNNGSLASSSFTVNGGTLAVTNNATLATAAAIIMNGGTLDLGSQNATNNQGNNNGISFGANGGTLNGSGIFYIIGTSAAATAMTVAANGNAVVNEAIWATNNLAGSYQDIASVGGGATLTINGQVYSHTSGNGIFFNGGGTLVLNNPSNHFSTLGVNGSSGGTVSVTNFGALGASGYINMGQSTGTGPVTFIYTGAAVTNSLSFQSASLTPGIFNNGTGRVTFSASSFTSPYGVPVSATAQTLTLGGTADIAITGKIQDANNIGTNGFNSNLVKTNANTLTLSGTNTYSGVTTVSGGALLVNGSIGTNSVTVVNSGTVLGGSGTIGGPVTFGSGTVATNNQGSPLTISGSLTLNNNTLKVATPSALGAGDYTLITYNATGSSGSFNPAPVISGAGLAANTTGTIVTAGGLVTLHVALNTQPTALVLSSSVNPSTYGQTVTFTAAIKTNSATAGNATSNVVFSVDGTPVTTNTLSGGQATYVTSLLSAPSHTIAATYSGDANYLPSTNSLTQTVNQTPLGITANNTNKTYNGVPFAGGNGVTYSGFVNGETPAVLGGSVSYGGTAQGATNAGSYTVIPLGQTSANYAISYTNGTLTISPASSFVGASSSENPSGYKDAVAYTATLPADATGSVVFSTTNGPISTNLVTGVTTTSLAITNLPRGTNAITVAYLGGGNYLGSTNTLNQIVTNHPPVAHANTYSRSHLASWKIAVSDLLANASDAIDGDPLTLVSVGTSTNLVTLDTTNLPGWVAYYNANPVADQFSYTVTDGYGGTNTGFISLNYIATNAIIGTNSIAAITGINPKVLTANGIPYYSYIAERSTNLSVWVDIATNAAASNGVIILTDYFGDLGSNAPASAYYRLKWQ